MIPGLIDMTPGRPEVGIAALVVLFVIGFVVLFAGGLLLFLWFRKRRMVGVEMVRPDITPTPIPAQASSPVHVNNPNQP